MRRVWGLVQRPAATLATVSVITIAGAAGTTSTAHGQTAVGTTERVSVSSTGEQGNGESRGGMVSADGRFVAFDSLATNLVPDDTNESVDVFVHDRQTRTTEVVSVNSSGDPAGGSVRGISGDGRFVAFVSAADDLVANDENGRYDLFVRDRQSGTTELVTVNSDGTQILHADILDGDSKATMSEDGQVFAFHMRFAGGSDGVVVRERDIGETYSVIFPHGPDPPSLSFDGTWLLTGHTESIWIHDLNNRTSEPLITGANLRWPSISRGGRYVAYIGDVDALPQVLVYDRVTEVTDQISRGASGEAPNGGSSAPAITGGPGANGRYVAFRSGATNLVPGGTVGGDTIFVFDRETDATELVSVSQTGEQVENSAERPSISQDGQVVAFESFDNDVVPGDANETGDVFVRDRSGIPPPPPPTKTVLSFGDSIAAGEGSGASGGFPNNDKAYSAVLASDLGWTSLNFAISGACAATAATGDSRTPSSCSADPATGRPEKSILATQIPAALAYQSVQGPIDPDLITVTIGANDIQFSACFQALLFEVVGKGASDPCNDAALKRSLAALKINLGLVLGQLRDLFPDAEIAVTRYFNMLPPSVDNNPASACSAMSYLYAYHSFINNGFGSLAGSLLTQSFDGDVAAFQADLFLRATSVLSKLNASIADVANAFGATVVPLNFGGHDFCQDYPGSTSTAWVLAPLATGSVAVRWAGQSFFREFSFLPTTRCVPQQPAPGCNVKPPFVGTGRIVLKKKGQTFTVDYTFFALLNDFPHLTPEGQQAVASAIRSELNL